MDSYFNLNPDSLNLQFVYDLLDETWHRSSAELLSFVALLLATIVARWLLNRLLNRLETRLAGYSKGDVARLFVEAIGKPVGTAVILEGVYWAIYALHLPERLMGVLDGVLGVVFMLLVAWMFARCVKVLTAMVRNWTQGSDNALYEHMVPLLERTLQISVWILAGLMIVQNMGYSIHGLLAGMGIGGLAIALAAQKTLSDFLGSVMLLVDRPFVAGDWIVSRERGIEGVVESVGFRSTRIRTFEQTIVSIPNNLLAESIIDNMSSRANRRAQIRVGLANDTPSEKMREVVSQIEQFLRAHPEVDQESAQLVHFGEITADSLDITAIFFTSTTVTADYLRIKEEVNVRIMEIVESLGLQLAFPTRTIHVSSGPDENGRE